MSAGGIHAADKPVKIYVFAGQSNMEARYGKDFLEKNHPNLLADRKIWHVDVGWPSGPIQDCANFGVDRAMVYQLAEATGQEIIVLRSAVGGTVLQTNWRPPGAVKRAGGTVGPLYMNLVTRFHNLVANLKEVYPAYHGQGYEIAGFVWFQGECDACSDTEVNGTKVCNCHFYEANLRNLISDVRRDFGVPDLPVLLAQINVSDPWEGKDQMIDKEGKPVETTKGQIVRDVEQKVAESTPNCTWVKTAGLSKDYHYDAAAYVVIGERMGEAMLPMLTKSHVASDAAMSKARKDFYDRVCPDLKPDTRSLAKGLVAAFGFDEGSGTVVTDSAGHKYKGELKGSDTHPPEWTKGLIGSAVKCMDGAQVSVPGFAEPAAPDGKIDRLSVSYWLNKSGHCGYGVQLGRRAGNERGWWIDEPNNGNRLGFHMVTEAGLYQEEMDMGEPSTLGDGHEWHHVAFVWDGPARRFDYYYDGQPSPRKMTHEKIDGKDTLVPMRPKAWRIIAADDKTPLVMGQCAWFGAMQGPLEAQAIDEVGIWNRPLSAAEIKALFNNGRGVRIIPK